MSSVAYLSRICSISINLSLVFDNFGNFVLYPVSILTIPIFSVSNFRIFNSNFADLYFSLRKIFYI